MKVCKNCTLNDNIFSVHINDEGLCNYCLQYNHNINKISTKEYVNAEKQLMGAFEEYRNLPYQVLLAYSGGKDSTFTLYKLRKIFKVSVLAITFDNGFLTEQCRHNIHEVTSNLDVDSITIKPSFPNLAKAFNLAAKEEIHTKKSLERASSICTTCIGMVKAAVYKEAILRKIPFICFGWTPGQVHVKAPIMRLDYSMIIANQKQILKPLVKNLGDLFTRYFIDPLWIESQKDYIPYLAYPLVFSRYSEEEIFDTIYSVGWRDPKDTDTNSTNCLLNSYANSVHVEKYGFNPYCLEVANLVREGFLSREEGLRKLSVSGEDSVIDYVKNELKKYPNP